MNIAELMRQKAFENKDVKQAYQKALADINESAREGNLCVELYNDETVLELLKKDGFNVSHILSPIKVKISW